MAVLLAASTVPVTAALRTWDAGGDKTNWFDAANWDPDGIPADTDAVVITNAATTVVLSNTTAWLDSFTISNTATLLFTNHAEGVELKLHATNVVVQDGANITHSPNTATATNLAGQWVANGRVWIVCTKLTVESGGRIDASTKGYRGCPAPTYGWGYGPGRGFVYGAGGYGGKAGGTGGEEIGGSPYGSITAPVDPGSGGGSHSYNNSVGGPGGGAVRIEVSGAVLVNGRILASGGTIGGTHAGGGSGGGIYITCRTFAGTNAGLQGAVLADGGKGGNNGGAGGRIAIVCDSTAQAAMGRSRVRFSANRAQETGSLAERGTLHLSDPFLVPEALTNWYGSVYGVNAIDAESLSFTTNGLVFVDPIQITVTNGLDIEGSALSWPLLSQLTVGGDLVLRRSTLTVGNTSVPTPCLIDVGGSVVLTGAVGNSSSWTIYSGPTNATTWTNCGASVGVTGLLHVGDSCYLYPWSDRTNGGSVFFQVGALTVTTGGTIHASGKGYTGGGANPIAPFGPGKGVAYSGAGYGGAGGKSTANLGGGTYGLLEAPAQCGSGGGSAGSGYYGGWGGGLIWISTTGRMDLSGSVLADGTSQANNGGAGSGGGIYLIADTLQAAFGTLSAKGGNSINSSWGAGGGGRVALIYRVDNFGGSINVDPGLVATNIPLAQTGTIYRAMASGWLNLMVEGSPARHGTSTPYNYGESGVFSGTAFTNTVNTPADQANGTRYHCLGYELSNDVEVLSGTSNEVAYTVTTNTTLIWLWTNVYELVCSAGANGGLQADLSGWYTNGTALTLTAVPAANYTFSQWSGAGVPDGSHRSNPLNLAMTQPRTVVAQFASNTPGTKVWTGTNDWFSASNWSPADVPGQADSVLVAGGAVTLRDPTWISALTVTNGTLWVQQTGEAPVALEVAGAGLISGTGAVVSVSNSTLTVSDGLTLTNSARLYACAALTNWAGTNYSALVNVGGSLVLHSNCWIHPTSLPTNGGAAMIRVHNLTASGHAGVSADGRGYRGSPMTVYGYGPGRGVAYGGAGHGGLGGRRTGESAGGGLTYGLSNSPVLAGSGGGGYSGIGVGGNGGGVLRIEAQGWVHVEGSLIANGTAAGGSGHSGGGSGGSLWLICRRLSGPPTATISANGGTGGVNSGGGGGGGRLRIDCMYDEFLGSISAAGGSGSGESGATGTVVRVFLRIPGSVFVVQ